MKFNLLSVISFLGLVAVAYGGYYINKDLMDQLNASQQSQKLLIENTISFYNDNVKKITQQILINEKKLEAFNQQSKSQVSRTLQQNDWVYSFFMKFLRIDRLRCYERNLYKTPLLLNFDSASIFDLISEIKSIDVTSLSEEEFLATKDKYLTQLDVLEKLVQQKLSIAQTKTKYQDVVGICGKI